MPVRCSAPWSTASRRSAVCAGQMTMSPSSRGPAAGPRELGDVVICPEHTADVVEATVHGVLHLCGFDHETDDGEMLRLQGRVLESP